MPISIAVFSILITLIDPDGYRDWVKTEFGLIENLTAAWMLPAMVFAFMSFRLRKWLPDARLGSWMLLMMFGCIYFGGEEMSWGQHWLGFGTPDGMQIINEQSETNIHNIYIVEWFADHVPRALLTIACAVAIFVPLWFQKKGITPDPGTSVHAWIWPTRDCMTVAITMFALRTPEKILEMFGHESPTIIDVASGGEMKECLLSMFMMIYLASFYIRLRRQKATYPDGLPQ